MRKRLIKLDEVVALTSLSKSSIYQFMAENRFPKSLRIGKRAVAWREADILAWIAARIAAL